MVNWIMISIIAGVFAACFISWVVVKIIKGMSYQIKMFGKIVRFLIELGLVGYIVWDLFL